MRPTHALVAFFTGILVAAPFASSALSIQDLQTQVQALMAKMGAMTVASPAMPQSDIAVSAVPRLCKLMPARALALGVRGEDVTGLQEFLRAEGYLSANASGYFGPQTRDALKRWQKAQGLSQVGIAGPQTRAALKARCGTSDALSVTPMRGQAPLTVTVTSNRGDGTDYRPSIADGQDTLIDFGDGTERQWVHCQTVMNDQFGGQTAGGVCREPVSFNHTYTMNGTFVVKLVQAGGMCVGGCPERTIATAYVTVGDQPVACTKEYAPVCGSKPVVCITTPCNPIEQTYSNRCMMHADGATFLHEGQCRNTSVDPSADPRCKAWYDGCNSCSRSTPGGPAMCTLRACTPESMRPAYCTAYFEGMKNRAPTISALSGPSSLAVDQVGTWKIEATDPENEQLTYSVRWGDEWTYADTAARLSAPSASIMQSASLTHAYSREGSYIVQLTVTDASGNSSNASASVRVDRDVACTGEYAPVCARPTGCANTCPPGQYCALICRLHEPATYPNRCHANAADATILHTGACTSADR